MWEKTLRTVLLIAIFTWTANALTNEIEKIESKGPKIINKEFSESQGNKIGDLKYSLKNEAECYNFQMKNDNPWVAVNLNGDIQVRKTWDYSELGPNKTIDFFVECKNQKTLENEEFHVIFNITVNPLRFLNEPQPMKTVIPLFALSQPNHRVYSFRAINSESNTAITYKKNPGKPNAGKFIVDEKTGDVYINGTQDFSKGEEYTIYIEAETRNINHTQSSGEQNLSIIIGNRPPQFYREKYETTVSENEKKNSDIITIKAISFTKNQEIKYDLKSRNSRSDGFFIINPATGVVKLDKELDYEDINQPKEHFLQITATDNTGLSTTVDLLIITIDVNDNPPIFDLPDYQVTKINEDIEINTNILNVTLKDADNGDNTAVEYSISDENFSIDSSGKIYTKKVLDADFNKALYEFNVTAMNILKPYFSTSSTVRVTTKNTNDESPQFPKANFSSKVDENVKAKTLVTTIIASDADNDGVYYSFDNGELISGPFIIDNKTGIVHLKDDHKSFDRDEYVINVTAYDNGQCCEDGEKIIHKNTTLLIVSITDMNDNRPVFDNCSHYAPTIEENKPMDTPVMTIKATDKDKGLNGMVKYSLVQNKDINYPKFRINESTGEVFTQEVFDREKSKTIPITVKATDFGKFPLEGVCSFTATITDVNDNAPFFDREKYDEVVLKPNDKIDSKIFKISASDFDAEENGTIVYTIQDKKDSSYFNIHPDSGWITLKKTLDPNKQKYELTVQASDRGRVPLGKTTGVTLSVLTEGLNKPSWLSPDNETISIAENSEINTLIHTMTATSGIEDNHELTFIMLLNHPPSDITYKNPFKIERRDKLGPDNSTTVDIFLNYNLDYETMPNYSYKIEVTNNNKLKASALLFINVIDTNDEPPEIISDRTEIVAEDKPIGTSVGTIKSIDLDGTPPYNTVTYSMNENENFRIDSKTGEIFTKKIFDREDKFANSYVMKVIAVDGALSARPNTKGPNSVSKDVRIEISDINDNYPSFVSANYQALVDENEDDKNKILVQVVAKDPDESSVLQYEIIDGNYGGAFTVDHDTGAIHVSGSIDYEKINKYELTIEASDSLHKNKTNVTINVRDLNDNAPVFEKPVYTVDIIEEDKNVPKYILTVKATDDDKQRPINMTYFLDKEDNFSINQTTGEISVMKPLDRDNGQPQIKFIVHAQDEQGDQGRIGVAEVWVNLADINDNSPVFTDHIYYAYVKENQDIGTEITTVTAIDRDEGNNAKITYSITKDVHDGESFEIESTTGLIKTAVSHFDRESKNEYMIQVVAKDGGGLKGTAGVSIRVTDVNDNPPKFIQDEWFVRVPETDKSNLPKTSFLTAKIVDEDEKDSNIFHYKILDSYGSDKFSIIRDHDGNASLKIIQQLDYEDPAHKNGFRFRIQVSDKGENNQDPKHFAYSWVNITLLDVNDNKPQFKDSNIRINISEATELETVVANFIATDIDNDGNSKVTYKIDRRSYFQIDENGTVRVSHSLDREEISTHRIQVLAIDDGTPAMTSTATLTVVLEDVNDNAPRLKNSVAMINENSPPHEFGIISAVDDDDNTKGNGPPFSYSMDPTASDDIKKSFQVNNRDNDEGTATVSSLVKFDREKQKKYYVPIVISDSGTPKMTGTSMLTVIIGDEDDNEMFPGTNKITVYNYNGKLPDSEIGRVYVNDADDWDVQNKIFHWINNQPDNPQFELKENGVIKMKSNTNDGDYQLHFNVEDKIRNKFVSADVFVQVKSISHEAVINSGSLRISGLSHEDFIRQEKGRNMTRLNAFKRKLSKYLDIKENNIDVFSVQQAQDDPLQTDIRFSVKNPQNVTREKLQKNQDYLGKLYYQPILLNDIILRNREELEHDAAINIVMVGINECINDKRQFDNGCTNKLDISNIPYVVNANTTGLVGVRVNVTKEYTCPARTFNDKETCATKHCYNGGKCVEDYYGAKCECEPGYNGPRCQLTTRSFGGNGWAWYPSLEICENSHLSFEFTTEKLDGQLIYNGPVAPPKSNIIDTTDFISVELINGFPKLLINLGTKIISVVIPRIDKPLNDGEWHRLDIIWNRFTIELIVDLCKNEKVYQKNNSINLNSTCHAIADVPLYNEYLNVNGPLQVGGLNVMKIDEFNWENKPKGIGFDGCMKNIIYNSKLYDLGFPGYERGSWPGCPQSEKICNQHLPKCGEHGSCVGSLTKADCQCHLGWFGSECDKKTIPATFNNESSVKYSLVFPLDVYTAEVQLRFRTRELNGELFRVSDKFISNDKFPKFAILEIKDSHVLFRYNLNNDVNDERQIMLSAIDVNDGQWHTVRVLRYGSAVILELDGGEGRHYNETIIFEGHQRLDVDKDEGIYAGGMNKSSGPNTFGDDGGYYNGCLDDIRLGDVYLPLSSEINKVQIGKIDVHKIVNECLAKTQCQANNATCSKPYQCVDTWNSHDCTCGDGKEFFANDTTCVDKDECLDFPCLNDGTCINVDAPIKYQCKCLDNFFGDNCQFVNGIVLFESYTIVMMNWQGIFINIICLVVLILLILLTRIEKKGGAVYQPAPQECDQLINSPPELPSSFPGWINEKKQKTDATVKSTLDDLRNYNYEGDGNSIITLSTISAGDEPDELRNFGPLDPRFGLLEDLFDSEDDSDENDDDRKNQQNPNNSQISEEFLWN